MNKRLRALRESVKAARHLTSAQKNGMVGLVANVGRELRTVESRLETAARQLARAQKSLKVHQRESGIEAALERVRARTMAMQKSDELSEVSFLLFQQFMQLGEVGEQISIGIFIEKDGLLELYATTHGNQWQRAARFEYDGQPVLKKLFLAWKTRQKSLVLDLRGSELQAYNAYKMERGKGHLYAEDELAKDRWVINAAYFSKGLVSFSAHKPRPREIIRLLERLAGVFEFTYTRFLDLKQAEAQSREAQIEACLERVRSRTLAMQSSDELAETAAVVFRQLMSLGIAPNRLYIAIIKDEGGNAEFWITDEDGSKVSAGFASDLHGTPTFQTMLEGWQKGEKSATIDMQGEQLREYFQYLSSLNVPFKGGLSQNRRVQTIAYFSRGFIGIASPETQPEETSTLLERFAAVFNLTFTRFNDLKVAEAHADQARRDLQQLQAEKKRAEETLTELRATQQQLVQQEKLASLGQLTAGIAHEIKNPLNFVNNFSSVSVELVEEAIAEVNSDGVDLKRGEIAQLLTDVKANLHKVLEHGTRADGIVKSMLHHSRGGTGKMEPTDLNALIKEYVNLAFHGMRAGKNPIAVEISLDLDESIGKAYLVAEDFSRVIVNVCQNAFDAMREKSEAGMRASQPVSFDPKLILRTRRSGPRIIMEVEDNGPGVPEAIRDKILQPFFTTKRGTQGTGLGLSITNDIVKAHRGELHIAANSGGGATFRIDLPAVAST